MQHDYSKLTSLSLSFAITLICLSAPGADWPQFMGPNGDGTSPEKNLLKDWPAEGPKVLWTVPLGKGYGGAAVQAGKVYLMDRVAQKEDVLRCLDLATGKEEWTFAYEAPGRIDHEGSRSTPAIGKERIYIIGPFGHLHCIDKNTHEVVWKKNLLSDYDGRKPNWAVTQSPLLSKDLVIVAPQSQNIGVVALEQATGKEVWRSGPIGRMAYGSPKLITIAGTEQFVVVNNDGAASVAAADGKVLWKFGHSCRIAVPNVTAMGGGKVFVTGGYNAGSAIFQVARDGEKWTTTELERISGVGGHCHPALFFKDHLYVLCNTNERQDGLVCFDSNGKKIWQTGRNPYLCKGGSILTADGIIYIMDGQSGELHAVDPSPEGFKSLAKAKLLGGREIWGPLALSNGKLLVRDQSQIKCVDLSAK